MVSKHSRLLVPTGWRRVAGMAALAAVLSACGGGGGGNGDGGAGSSATVSASASSVSAAATYADGVPTRNFTVELENPPRDAVYVGVEHGFNGVQQVDFTEITPGKAEFTVTFRPPVDVDVGSVTDTITLTVCEDANCNRQVQGSPLRIRATYTVSSPTSATISTTTLTAQGSTNLSTPVALNAIVSLTGAGVTPPIIAPNYSTSVIQSITSTNASANEVDVALNLWPGSSVAVGTHTDNVQIRVCYDTYCQRQVNGSPFTIVLTYTVTDDPVAEPGLDPVPFASRLTLSHDVIDAEFTKALNAIVIVSSWPRNALYLYDVATGTEREAPLSKTPTAVSVAPDGLSAAVGHDALISLLQLASVGQPAAAAPVLLNVSTDVLDLVLDGHGHVHALPRADQWEAVHSVDIATNTEALDPAGFLYAGTLGSLHPSGDYLYTADNGLSPSDIAKYDLRTGVAHRLYDSPYHGDYGMCGNVWMKEDGTTLYTRCGNTFRSSTIQGQDMIYAGRLALSNAIYGYQIASLSQSDAVDEIALIEFDPYGCASYVNPANCYTHLGLYESTYLNRQALYSIPPVTVAGTAYGQRGLFVFHTADGAGRIMLSRLHGMSNPAAEFYLTVLGQ